MKQEGQGGPVSLIWLPDKLETLSNIFSSEITGPVEVRFYMKHVCLVGTKVYVIGPGHITKVHTAGNYYKFLFVPSPVVYWNQLSAIMVLLPTLDQFSVAVQSHDHHIL